MTTIEEAISQVQQMSILETASLEVRKACADVYMQLVMAKSEFEASKSYSALQTAELESVNAQLMKAEAQAKKAEADRQEVVHLRSESIRQLQQAIAKLKKERDEARAKSEKTLRPISLREVVAAKAIVGILASGETSTSTAASRAVNIADALLEELGEKSIDTLEEAPK